METPPDDDIPSGLPPEQPEAPPLGIPVDDDEKPASGPDAMPGIPSEGDPPETG